MDKVKRITKLVKQLNIYRDSYYNDSISLVDDREYDALFAVLSTLEQETGLALSNSPTRQVGYEVKSKLDKAEHNPPLLSLDKKKDLSEIIKFIGYKDALLMLKLDGLTNEIEYRDGFLYKGSTRGDGYIGDDITHSCKQYMNLPLSIPFKGRLRMSGEAFIHFNNFEKINQNLTPEEKKKLPSGKYKTPRNLASGSVRQLNSEICKKRHLYFHPFNILEAEGMKFSLKSEQLEWLDSLGFSSVLYAKINCDNVIILEKIIRDMRKNSEEYYVPIDGMVITYDDIKYSESLGKTAHHKLDGISYKFEDERKETILYDVEWNTTRTGQINPTAIFNTVILDGTEVNRASLFNLTFVKEKKLNIGCRVKVSKRNMIIPYIEENLDIDKGDLLIPQYCPSCAKETTIKNTGTAEFLCCINPKCPAQLLDKFIHFVSKAGMDIDGLSEATLEKFINKGFLKSFDDVYNLEQYKSQIVSMEGFGLKSYNKLIENIDKSRKVKCANLIYALGIPQIGKGGAKIIAEHFENDFSGFIESIEDGFDFSKLKDFGETTCNEIYKWYKDVQCRELWMGVLEEIQVIQEVKKEVSNTDNLFNGKKTYCTGTFANYKKNQLKELLEGLGAEFASGYAKSLDYLIVGGIKGSSKTDKAQKDGVPVLTEDQFIKMIK